MTSETATFERHIARLLITLNYCGRPINSLLEGEVRQVDSIWELQRFDFWIREPGHLALALLDTATSDDADRRDALLPLLRDDQIDVHRIALPGAPYNILEDFDFSLSFLTSRGLVSDRPSFVRSKNYGHQVILENAGIEIVQKILAECPSFHWYKQQCETVSRFFTALELVDLVAMPYLQPDLTPIQAASAPLTPIVRARFQNVFGKLGEPVQDALV
jgi:hypothetical protein